MRPLGGENNTKLYCTRTQTANYVARKNAARKVHSLGGGETTRNFSALALALKPEILSHAKTPSKRCVHSVKKKKTTTQNFSARAPKRQILTHAKTPAKRCVHSGGENNAKL